MSRFPCLLVLLSVACASYPRIELPGNSKNMLSGSQFYKQTIGYNWSRRDSLASKEILNGAIPAFLRKLEPVQISMNDSQGRKVKATLYVTSDYLSIGTDDDWARIPLTPMAAQKIADTLNCFLPTRKIVDAIYRSARVKLDPMPLYAFRDSTPTMYHHHLIIEGQRRNRDGLIAGIKKDVVISGKISRDQKPNRVAIYGWHKTDGKPIQPLYTGHVNWYVDYSHGIRLVSRRIKVNGKWMDYIDILKDPVLQKLICDEDYCDFLRYQ